MEVKKEKEGEKKRTGPYRHFFPLPALTAWNATMHDNGKERKELEISGASVRYRHL